MARKGREPAVEAPPPAASSSDDEEEEDDESSDDEQPPPTQHRQSSSSTEEEDDDDENAEEENSPSPPPQKGPTQKKQPGSPKPADSDSGSDSDSEPPPKKPTSMDAKKSKPKPAATAAVTVLASPVPVAKAKRKASDKGTPKKVKKEKIEVSGAPLDEGKKPLFQRLWGEDDEIAILQGMIEYKAKKGTDSMADAEGFMEFVKKSLHIDVSRNQIISKVRALKRKFETAKKKKKITDPHGVKMFELSKRVWETDEIKNNGVVEGKDSNLRSQNVKKSGNVERLEGGKNGPVSEAEKEEKVRNGMISMGEKERNLEDLVNFWSTKDGFLREGVKLLGADEKAKLDEKWRKQNMAEMELYLKRLDLIRELTEKTLNAIK